VTGGDLTIGIAGTVDVEAGSTSSDVTFDDVGVSGAATSRSTSWTMAPT